MCSVPGCRWPSVYVKGERGTVLAKYCVLAAGFVLSQVQGTFRLVTILSWMERRSECLYLCNINSHTSYLVKETHDTSFYETGQGIFWRVWRGMVSVGVSLYSGSSVPLGLWCDGTIWLSNPAGPCKKMFSLGRSVCTLSPSYFMPIRNPLLYFKCFPLVFCKR